MRRAPFVLLLFAGFAMAQGAPESAASPERLQALLKELAGLEPKAWAARIAALEAQAAESERNAKALRAEIARLEELRRLLAASPASRPSSAAASKPASKPVERPASVPRAAPGPVAELVTFDKQVGRIFEEHCTSCHDLDDKKGGLDLSTFAGVRQGGGSGRTVVPGDPEQSRLWRMVAREERPFMPKDADPLSREVLQTLRTWIEQGAAEDAAAARAFLAKKDAAAKPAATTAPVLAETGPLPEGLPKVPVTTGVRPAPIHCLVRSPRAPLLAMPGLRQVLFFDTALRPLGVLATPFAHVGAVAFAGDGTLLAAAGGEPGKSGRAQVFDVRSGAVRATVGAERDVPLAVAVHAGLGLVALGGAGKSVKAFRLADGGEVFSGKHEDFVLALAFSDDGALLAAADRSGAVQVWETKGGRLLSTLAGHKGAVHAVAFQPGSRALVRDRKSVV